MEEDEMTGVRSSVEKIVQLLNPANLATLVLHGISALLVGIIQVVILGIGVVIVKLLVILGPFVFAVSMLPVFQKQLSIWFGTLCSACMVFTVINILNQSYGRPSRPSIRKVPTWWTQLRSRYNI